MRLEKPVGTWLLLLPCYWGITMASYSIAAPLWVTTKAIALFSVGALVMRVLGVPSMIFGIEIWITRLPVLWRDQLPVEEFQSHKLLRGWAYNVLPGWQCY